MSNLDYAQNRLLAVSQRIQRACEHARRPSAEVTLVGASKKQSAELVSQFAQAGLAHVGENYVQEGVDKMVLVNNDALQWHFIGSIQSNKTKLIAQHFDWVHSIDRLKIAQRLAKQQPAGKSLNLLIQLNPDQEASKAGVALANGAELADQISQLGKVNLRGFMMIPQARQQKHQQQQVFALARELLERSNQRYGLHMDHLSMGMSGDLEAAITEGATMIRVGTDLFGARSA